jgi:hypothetical protein
MFKDLMESVFNKEYKEIEEGQGLNPNRPAGDVYKNDAGEELTFEKFTSLPVDEYDVETVKATMGTDSVVELNEIIPKHKVANIILFNTSNGEQVAYVVFKSGSSRVDHKEFGDLSGYYRQGRTSKKETAPIKPSDLIAADVLLTPDELLQSLESGLENSSVNDTIKLDITNLVQNFVSQEEGTVSLNNPELATAYRDYIGEILAPWACVKRMNVEGDYESSQEALIPSDYSYADMKIFFSSSKNEKLRDSSLILADTDEEFDPENDNNINIGLSSKAKAGGGFAASINNLLDGIEMQSRQWIRSNKKIATIVKRVSEERQEHGPVILAQEAGLLKEFQADRFITYIDKVKRKEINPKDYNKLPPGSRSFINYIVPTDPGKAIAFFHVLAGMAKKASEILNNDPKISKGILQLLNNSSLIQVYTDVYFKSPEMKFKGFMIKYPPTFKGKAVLWPGTRFKTTSIQGKIGYKLL